MGTLLRELEPLLHLDTIDVTGRTLAQCFADPIDWVDRRVIRAFAPIPKRGYKMLYRKTVLQAPAGCDFDFLAKEATDD